jgi:hypothetical protein
VLVLPLWDLIPGLFFYWMAVHQRAGVHIHEHVTASGYLDTWVNCDSCWRMTQISRSHGWSKTARYGWYPLLEFSWNEVRDRETGRAVADAVRVRFRSWLSRRIGIPVFTHANAPDGKPDYLEIEEIIRPTGN